MEIVFREAQVVEGDTGTLCVVNAYKEIPFEIKRVFWISDLTPMDMRGAHAHKTLKQVIFCVHGECTLLMDNGKEKKVSKLDRYEGAYVEDEWHELYNFTNDCVLLVFASDLYNEGDYIREYDTYLRFKKAI